MDYEKAKELKDAGFPQTDLVLVRKIMDDTLDPISYPTLSELIEACGDSFEALIKQAGGWAAIHNIEQYMGVPNSHLGTTPEEAVANLWLALNKKS